MTAVVDLFSLADRDVGEGRMWSADVAKFNEVPNTPRVFADSAHYITYTMKKGNSLRVVKRVNLSKGAVRVHTTAIHAVRFVNYRSNVAASASKGEFFVWVVTGGGDADVGIPGSGNELTINVYFRLSDPTTIRCFSFFINAESKRPDVLVLHDQQATILNSSALIELYRDAPLEATLKQNSTPLRKLTSSVTANSLCSVGSGGWFAFTSEPNSVVACTLQNRNTPPWPCCEGSPVQSLHLLDTPQTEKTTLIAACSRAVYQWSLSGASEPTLLRRFVVSGNIISVECSREVFAVFDDRQRVAVVQAGLHEKFKCTRYALPWQVRRNGICFNSVGECSSIMADNDDRLTVMHLKPDVSSKEKEESSTRAIGSPVNMAEPVNDLLESFSGTKIRSNSSKSTGGSIIAKLFTHFGKRSTEAAPSPPSASPEALVQTTANVASAAGSSANGAQRTASRIYGNQPVTAGLGSGANKGAPKAYSSDSTRALAASADRGQEETSVTPVTPDISGAAGASASAQPPRSALHNASLPQAPTEGVLAAVLRQSESEVRQQLDQLESAMKNTLQILQLTPDTIHRAHEQLLNLSLEAQMTELQRQEPQGLVASSNSGNFPPFETCVLLSILKPVSQSIAKGLTRGIEKSMEIHLEQAAQLAFTSRAQSLKTRLDGVLKGSASLFLAQVEQSVQDVVQGELAEVFGGINTLLTTLMNDNNRLQRELEAIMATDTVNEMKRTREELRLLREAVANQQLVTGSTVPQASRLPPETILSVTADLMQKQEFHRSLEYLIAAERPQLVLQLFTSLKRKSENLYSALIGDVAVPNDVWLRLITQIIGAPTSEEEMDAVVGVLIDVISEREYLLQRTGPAAKLTERLHTFVSSGKSVRKCSSGLRNLKNLEKLLP